MNDGAGRGDPAGGHRHVTTEKPREIMNVNDLLLGAMAAVRQRTGSEVALYVQKDMLHTGEDGIVRYLPVIAVGKGGYDPVPARLREQVALHFGALLAVAEVRVEDINARYGLEPDDALEIVRRSFNQSAVS